MTSMADSLVAAAQATRQRWNARYRDGVTPWDTQITPPEVEAFWQRNDVRPHGLALDMGCGSGTNVRFLANLGLTVIGVEIAGAPLLTARQRLARFAPAARAHLVCADVSMLPFHSLNATYILDIGCFHSLPRIMRPGYVQGVINNLAPAGYYHLYAFDSDPANPDPPSGPVGVDAGEIAAHYAPHLRVIEEVIARPDRRPCRWYLLQRPA